MIPPVTRLYPGSARLSLAEVDRKYPEASLYADAALSHFHSAPGGLEYVEVLRGGSPSGLSLCALAIAWGPHERMRRETWRLPPPAPFGMYAKWVPEMRLWIRCSVGLTSYPRNPAPQDEGVSR